MRIYLGDLELPVTPERFEVFTEGAWEKADLCDLGEINLFKPPKLRLFKFGGFFPGDDYSFVTANRRSSPDTYITSLDRLAAAKEPFRLVVTEGPCPFSVLVTIETFHWRLQVRIRISILSWNSGNIGISARLQSLSLPLMDPLLLLPLLLALLLLLPPRIPLHLLSTLSKKATPFGLSQKNFWATAPVIRNWLPLIIFQIQT